MWPRIIRLEDCSSFTESHRFINTLTKCRFLEQTRPFGAFNCLHIFPNHNARYSRRRSFDRYLVEMPRKTDSKELASIEHGEFDTAALQQELAAALEEDRLYKLTDSMKKRAIHTAANYDEFKNMVACADLKPVTQRELQNLAKTSRPQNLFYGSGARASRRGKSSGVGDRINTLLQEPTDMPPATAVEFCRCWNRSLKSVEAKERYLKLTGPEQLKTIFQADLDADLMAEIVHVLVASWDASSSSDQAKVRFNLHTLVALASTSRFSLLRDFLDNNQLDKVQELLALIEHHASMLDADELHLVDAIRTKFRLSK